MVPSAQPPAERPGGERSHVPRGASPRPRAADTHAASVWNLANALTTLRLAMVPFFGWALLNQDGSVLWRCIAFGVFGVAMLTDKVDGDLARKQGLVTNVGKIADPIADKALTGMAFIGLSVIGELWWWVTALVLLREWSVTLLRLSVMKHVVIAAKQGGKIKTVLQTGALGAFILPLRDLPGGWQPVGQGLWWVAAALMGLAVAATVWTGAEFFLDAVRQRRRQVRASPLT